MTSTSDSRVQRLGNVGGGIEEVKKYMYADAVHGLDFLSNEGKKYSSTALSVAIDKRRPYMVRILLERGASPETYYDEEYGIPILAAARARSVEIAQLLLDAGADVDTCDKYGVTALIIATRNGDLGLVKLLLGRGANLDHMTRTEFLPEGQKIRAKSLPNDWFETRMEPWGSSNPLIEACRYRHVQVVKKLLKRGADTSKTTSLGSSALHIAAVGEAKERYRQVVGKPEQKYLPTCPEIVYILLQNGADVSAMNHFRETPVIALLAEMDRVSGNVKASEYSQRCLSYYYINYCLLVQAGSRINSDCLTNTPITHKPRVGGQGNSASDVSSMSTLSILTTAYAKVKFLEDQTRLFMSRCATTRKPSTCFQFDNSNQEHQQSNDQCGPERRLNESFTEAVDLTVVSGYDLTGDDLDSVTEGLGHRVSRPSNLRQLCQIKIRNEIMKPQLGNIFSKLSKEHCLPAYLKQCIMLQRDVPVVSLVTLDDANCALHQND